METMLDKLFSVTLGGILNKGQSPQGKNSFKNKKIDIEKPTKLHGVEVNEVLSRREKKRLHTKFILSKPYGKCT